jgi:hypothetical protein
MLSLRIQAAIELFVRGRSVFLKKEIYYKATKKEIYYKATNQYNGNQQNHSENISLQARS